MARTPPLNPIQKAKAYQAGYDAAKRDALEARLAEDAASQIGAALMLHGLARSAFEGV